MQRIEWNELSVLLDVLHARAISTLGDGGPGGIQVYGVPRGGAVVAGLLVTAYSNYTQVYSVDEADLIVDDLIDSGKTVEGFATNHPTTPFMALIDKRETHKGQWLEFPWESGSTQTDMEGVVIRLLEFWGENPAREGLKETPARFLKGMSEMLSGYRTDPTAHLKKHFDISDVEASRYDQVIISKDIPFVSFCEHHLMPFFGQVHIGYLPDPEHGRVVGLSKLARCVEGYSQRLQVQERLTRQIHDAINDVMKPAGTMVLVEGTHTCQCWRGVKKNGSMVTSAIGGVFRTDPAARGEVLALFKS